MATFQVFSMAAAAIVDFKIFTFLTVGTFKRVKLHHCAKFHRNRTNRGRDIVEIGPNAAQISRIIDFSRWQPPPSWIFKISNF